MSPEKRMPITPETKVGELLTAYPELEAVLIDLAPPFARLRNPVLRKTVARVTSLQQAARVAGMPVAAIVNRLRQAVGDEALLPDEAVGPAGVSEPPPWFSSERIDVALDVRPLLDRGEKPMNAVLEQFRSLAPGRILELTAPFLPAPLIDLGQARGLLAWSRQEGPETVRVYFCRPPSAPGEAEAEWVDLD